MWQVGLLMETIKVYCNADEKKRIMEIATASGQKASKYLLQEGLRKGLGDLPVRAMLTELIGYMVRLLDAGTLADTVQEDLFGIAQNVLEGGSIDVARAQIAEVCRNADQGSQGL